MRNTLLSLSVISMLSLATLAIATPPHPGTIESPEATAAVSSVLDDAHSAYKIPYGSTVKDITDGLDYILPAEGSFIYMTFSADNSGKFYAYYLDKEKFKSSITKADPNFKTCFYPKKHQFVVLDKNEKPVVTINLKTLQKKR